MEPLLTVSLTEFEWMDIFLAIKEGNLEIDFLSPTPVVWVNNHKIGVVNTDDDVTLCDLLKIAARYLRKNNLV